MTPTSSDKPVFGPRPNTKAMSFDFKPEVNPLPFKLNLGQDAKMTQVQQSWFIDIIYDHPEIFSLHDEDLRFSDQIKQTILMTLDKPGENSSVHGLSEVQVNYSKRCISTTQN